MELKSTVFIFLLLVIAVFCYCFMLARLKHKVVFFRNFILIPATVISGGIVYYYGYITIPDMNRGIAILNAIHSTAAMTLLRSDFKSVSEVARSSNLYILAFTIAHFFGIMLTVTTALSLWGRRLNATFSLLTTMRKPCYVFFNSNEESLTLAKDILREDTKRQVYFIAKHNTKIDSTLLDTIESMGAYCVDNTNTNNKIGGKMLFRRMIHTKSKLFYISEDEDKNINDALHLFTLINKQSISKKQEAEANICIFIQIDSEDMTQIFEEARKKMNITLEYSVFNVPEIISTQVVNTYNPVNYIALDTETGTATEDYEVMIIGFGRNGRSIMRRVLEYGQFVGSTFRATVIDRSIDTKMGSFDTNYPALNDNYNIVPVSDYVGSSTFFKLLKERSHSLNQIIISLNDSALNVKTAIEINKMLNTLGIKHIDIIIVTRKNDNYLYLHNSNEFESIHCVGQNKDIFSADIIINDTLRESAKIIHAYYNSKQKPEKQKQWHELEIIKQLSNISAASHINTKLKLLGLTKDDVLKMSEPEFIDYLASNPRRFTNIAITEHLRWNASYFVRGWNSWAVNPESQDHKQKLHVCLVDWDTLNELDKYYSTQYQSYDYNNVAILHETIHMLNKRILV